MKHSAMPGDFSHGFSHRFSCVWRRLRKQTSFKCAAVLVQVHCSCGDRARSL